MVTVYFIIIYTIIFWQFASLLQGRIKQWQARFPAMVSSARMSVANNLSKIPLDKPGALI